MTFAFGSFTLGAALLVSAFKNQTLISLILGLPGHSIASQGESHPSAEGGGSGGGTGGVEVTSPSGGHGFSVPKGTSQSKMAQLRKGAAKIVWMSGRFPYSWGGGHSTFCHADGRAEHGGPGFDCSGCWSCVLGIMGIISAPMTSGAMASAFASGPGKYITLWANDVHVFGTFLGVPFATGHAREAKRGGPAIGNNDNGNKGEYKECHPKGW